MVTLITGSQILKVFCAVFGICARKNLSSINLSISSSINFFDEYSFKQLCREMRGQWQKCYGEASMSIYYYVFLGPFQIQTIAQGSTVFFFFFFHWKGRMHETDESPIKYKQRNTAIMMHNINRCIPVKIKLHSNFVVLKRLMLVHTYAFTTNGN